MGYPSHFQRQYYIDGEFYSSTAGWVSVSTSGQGEEEFWQCRVTNSSPLGKYKFDHWEYSGIIPEWMGTNTSSYRRTKNKGSETAEGTMTVMAFFVSQTEPPGPVVSSFTVTTAASPTQGGITTGGGVYVPGASVTLSAMPKTGFRFLCWNLSTGIQSTQNIYQFLMPAANVTAVAYFVQCTNKILRYK